MCTQKDTRTLLSHFLEEKLSAALGMFFNNVKVRVDERAFLGQNAFKVALTVYAPDGKTLNTSCEYTAKELDTIPMSHIMGRILRNCMLPLVENAVACVLNPETDKDF